jgi:hypothetical protein
MVIQHFRPVGFGAAFLHGIATDSTIDTVLIGTNPNLTLIKTLIKSIHGSLNKGFAKVLFEYRIRQEKNGNRRSCFAFYRLKGTNGRKAAKALLKWKNGDD